MSVLQLCCKGTNFSRIMQVFLQLFFKKMQKLITYSLLTPDILISVF